MKISERQLLAEMLRGSFLRIWMHSKLQNLMWANQLGNTPLQGFRPDFTSKNDQKCLLQCLHKTFYTNIVLALIERKYPSKNHDILSMSVSWKLTNSWTKDIKEIQRVSEQSLRVMFSKALSQRSMCLPLTRRLNICVCQRVKDPTKRLLLQGKYQINRYFVCVDTTLIHIAAPVCERQGRILPSKTSWLVAYPTWIPLITHHHDNQSLRSFPSPKSKVWEQQPIDNRPPLKPGLPKHVEQSWILLQAECRRTVLFHYDRENDAVFFRHFVTWQSTFWVWVTPIVFGWFGMKFEMCHRVHNTILFGPLCSFMISSWTRSNSMRRELTHIFRLNSANYHAMLNYVELLHF